MNHRTTLAIVCLASLLAGAPAASAHGTACCAAKACPPESPACSNEGRRCISDVEENLADSIEDQRVLPAGCVDGESDVCIGGRAEPSGPEGCVGLGPDLYFVGDQTSGPVTREECIAAAVDACCAAGACQ